MFFTDENFKKSPHSFTLLFILLTIGKPDEITLLLFVRAAYKWVLFFSLIPFMVNGTFNATPNTN